jgi:hypothetical protein
VATLRKKQMKPAKQPESIGTDRTPLREKLWRELGSATYDAVSFGLPRAVVIRTLIEIADNICSVAAENNEDLSELEGLLQWIASFFAGLVIGVCALAFIASRFAGPNRPAAETKRTIAATSVSVNGNGSYPATLSEQLAIFKQTDGRA